MPKPKTSALETAMAKFEETFSKTFGAGALVKGEDILPYEIIPTGSLTLDVATGVGGIVEGRITEIWGSDGVIKSTLCMWLLREAQIKHPDKAVAWIDVENKLDKIWMAQQGVDLRWVRVYTPDNAEDVADALKDIIRSGLFSIVVLDSIAAMLPEAEKEKDADKAVMMAQAKIVTRMAKIAVGAARKTSTAVVFINQVRANIAYGADQTTGGGFALKHCSTMKMKCRHTGTPPYKATVKGDKDVIVGREIALYMERNNVAPAYKTAVITFFNQTTEKYGPIGVDRADEAATLGVKSKIIKQAGAWYTLPNSERYQGRESLVDALRAQPDLVDELRVQILATLATDVYTEEHEEEGEPEVEFLTGSPAA
jgi:recombination protein RecA